mmetsp:Transcript_48552/g.125983  ORF Transcript_48552/g.125983 Transcript_48552/m.125983 type:complete len:132 (+) Transcript_48552:691-1086(+)
MMSEEHLSKVAQFEIIENVNKAQDEVDEKRLLQAARKEEWQKERDSVQQERREKRVQKKRLREEKLAGNVPLEMVPVPTPESDESIPKKKRIIKKVIRKVKKRTGESTQNTGSKKVTKVIRKKVVKKKSSA